jgi:hypothetical protein
MPESISTHAPECAPPAADPAALAPSCSHPHAPASIRTRLVNLAVVVVPFLALIAAIFLLWGVAFNWVYLGLSSSAC